MEGPTSDVVGLHQRIKCEPPVNRLVSGVDPKQVRQLVGARLPSLKGLEFREGSARTFAELFDAHLRPIVPRFVREVCPPPMEGPTSDVVDLYWQIGWGPPVDRLVRDVYPKQVHLLLKTHCPPPRELKFRDGSTRTFAEFLDAHRRPIAPRFVREVCLPSLKETKDIGKLPL